MHHNVRALPPVHPLLDDFSHSPVRRIGSSVATYPHSCSRPSSYGMATELRVPRLARDTCVRRADVGYRCYGSGTGEGDVHRLSVHISPASPGVRIRWGARLRAVGDTARLRQTSTSPLLNFSRSLFHALFPQVCLLGSTGLSRAREGLATYSLAARYGTWRKTLSPARLRMAHHAMRGKP
jgi:hypothetical protein